MKFRKQPLAVSLFVFVFFGIGVLIRWSQGAADEDALLAMLVLAGVLSVASAIALLRARFEAED